MKCYHENCKTIPDIKVVITDTGYNPRLQGYSCNLHTNRHLPGVRKSDVAQPENRRTSLGRQYEKTHEVL